MEMLKGMRRSSSTITRMRIKMAPGTGMGMSMGMRKRRMMMMIMRVRKGCRMRISISRFITLCKPHFLFFTVKHDLSSRVNSNSLSRFMTYNQTHLYSDGRRPSFGDERRFVDLAGRYQLVLVARQGAQDRGSRVYPGGEYRDAFREVG